MCVMEETLVIAESTIVNFKVQLVLFLKHFRGHCLKEVFQNLNIHKLPGYVSGSKSL